MKAIGAVAIVWLLGALAALVFLWPSLPRSVGEWVLLLAIGPPLYLLGEAFFGWLLSAEHGRKISSAGFSFLRIGLLLVVVGVCVALSIILAQSLERP